VDLATAAQAAHWFDLPAYYAEVRRVTRPGGIIALVSYGVLEADDDLDRIIQPFYRTCWLPTGRPSAGMWTRATARCPSRSRSSRLPRSRSGSIGRLAELVGYVGTWSAVGVSSRRRGRGPSPRSAATWRAHGGQPRRSVLCAGPWRSASVACDATPSDLLETSQELQHGEARARRQLYEPVTCRPRLAPVEANRLGDGLGPPVVQERRSEMQPHQRLGPDSAGRASPRQMSARAGPMV